MPDSRSPFFDKTGEHNFFTASRSPGTPFFSRGENNIIQKSEEGEEETPSVREVTPGNNPDYIQVRNMMIEIACAKMIELRHAAENGLVWEFEDEDLILGSEMVDRGAAGVTPILDQRAEALGEAISSLAQLIAALEEGSYQIHYLSSRRYSDLVAHISDLRTQYGLPAPEMLTWTQHSEEGSLFRGSSGFLSYIRIPPGTTSALPPSTIPWWAPVLPEACSPEQTASEEAVTTHNTPFWVHISDTINHPERVDRVDRDYPRSNTGLQTPPTGTTRLTSEGDSFPLMREGELYFYMLNGRRINMPGLQIQFPQLAE